MKFGQYGVFTFTDAMNGAELTELAQRLEALGYSTLWYPEAFNYEPFAIGAYLLGASKKLVVASGIANIYARDAASSVMGHNSLNKLYGERFVLGLGVSHAPLVSDLRGHEYKQPVATMRAYLDRMDQAWTALGGAPGEKRVVLAALGPQMSKLAAERTLGTFPYNITPAQVDLSKSAMGGKGAIICEQKVCLCEDPTLARKAARAALAPYMGLPNYFNNWFRLGFDQSDLKDGGSDRLMDAMVLWGSAADIKAKLKAYFDKGAAQVVVQPIRADGEVGPCWKALEALAPGA
ncbi:MAG: TIGR03620 family F420-dependent LLM class oxidoreductase [Gammaproteobacteria bacterium]|nr:TIGR03620 family F420-dependent LLM class oxidoreductase [Gammaproteobacteria bacterium]